MAFVEAGERKSSVAADELEAGAGDAAGGRGHGPQ